MNQRIAILDLGTNTYNLLIAEWDKGLKPIFRQKIPVMMGKMGLKNGIKPDAFERAIAAIHELNKHIKEYGVKELRAFATSAIRSAVNGKELVQQIKRLEGIEVRVISGLEEAGLIFSGVKCAGVESPNALIMDIGGGSTEFILVLENKIKKSWSFNHGVARLKEQFPFSDPCALNEKEEIIAFLRSEWREVAETIGENTIDFIGCSGSFETAYQMFTYADGNSMDLNWVVAEIEKKKWEGVYEFLMESKREDRELHPAIIPLRVEYMVYAGILMELGLKMTKASHITVCDFALKEGAAYDYFSDL